MIEVQVTKRLVYMPLMFFIFVNVKQLSPTTHTLAEVHKLMRKERIMGNRYGTQELLWNLIIASFWSSDLHHA